MNREQDGSVLLLGIGFMLIALTTLLLMTTLANVRIAKFQVAATTDAAALHGIGAIDLDSIYESGIGAGIPINQRAARVRINNYLQIVSNETSLTNYRISSLAVNDNQLELVLCANAKLTFGYLFGKSEAKVCAQAWSTHIIGPAAG